MDESHVIPRWRPSGCKMVCWMNGFPGRGPIWRTRVEEESQDADGARRLTLSWQSSDLSRSAWHTHTHTQVTHTHAQRWPVMSARLLVQPSSSFWTWFFIGFGLLLIGWRIRSADSIGCVTLSSPSLRAQIKILELIFSKKFNLILKIEFKIKFLKSNFKLNKNDF